MRKEDQLHRTGNGKRALTAVQVFPPGQPAEVEQSIKTGAHGERKRLETIESTNYGVMVVRSLRMDQNPCWGVAALQDATG